MITKLNMVILLQKDMHKAVEFYQNLGLHLKFHMAGKWAEFILNDLKIGLCPTSSHVDGFRTGLVLEVDDLYKTYNALKDTINFVNKPLEKAHGIMVSLKDPGGNIIDLYQATPEKLKELMEKAKQRDACCGGTKVDCKDAKLAEKSDDGGDA